MNNIRFSIIVPIYNKEKYIKECIDSILSQSYTNYELILVDDGSSDKSSIICDEYKNKDERITVIHKENGGLVSARKAGTRIAVGEYIICVDGDDYIKHNYLEIINREINNNHPDIICTNSYRLNEEEEENIIPFSKGFYNKDRIIKDIFPFLIQHQDATYFPVNIWAKAFKNDLYKKIQLKVDDTISIGEDGCVSVPFIYLANSLSIIDDFLYVYRLNDISMTSHNNVYISDYPKRVVDSYLQYISLDEYDFKEQIDRFYVHQLFSICRSQFYGDAKYKEVSLNIKHILEDETYKNALNNAVFKDNKKAILMHNLLKKKRIFMIYVLSSLLKG